MDTNDFLFGSGSKSASFENIGDSITGTIKATEVSQQTDIKDGSPKTWPSGDPMMQLVVTLQTSLRDPEIEDDDGKRNVYITGSKKSGTRSKHDAVASAVRESGAKGLEIGGTLMLTFAGNEPSTTKGFSDRKLWSASYVKPNAATTTGGFLGTAQPAQQVQQSQAPTVPDLTPQQIAAFEAWQRSQQSA